MANNPTSPTHAPGGDRLPAEDGLAQSLSAVADGAATPGELDEVLRAWSDDAGLRARWHRYQLMGDVMRSAQLAHSPQRDLDLSSALNNALAREPERLIPATPAATSPEPSWARAWTHALAAAAGLGAVAVVAWTLAVDEPPPATGPVARHLAPPAAEMVVATGTPAPGPSATASGGRAQPSHAADAMRDAQFDRYLAAHRSAVIPVGWSTAADARPQAIGR